MNIIFNLVLLLLFGIYIEFFSRVGNLIIRINHTGYKVFQPFQLFYIIIAPLSKNFMWNLNNWDINYFIIFAIGNVIYYIFEKIYNIYRRKQVKAI